MTTDTRLVLLAVAVTALFAAFVGLTSAVLSLLDAASPSVAITRFGASFATTMALGLTVVIVLFGLT